MVIKYGCVTLRAIEERDSEFLYKMLESEKIEKAMGHCTVPISMDQHLDWIGKFRNSEKEIRLMIELENGNVIGTVMLFDIDNRNGTGEIGYKVMASKDERMEGDVRDAIDGTLDFAFNNLRLHLVYARVPAGNIPSENVLNRAGFTKEGVLRHRIYQDGEYLDLTSFSLTDQEFNNRK